MFPEAFPASDRLIFGPVSWDGVTLAYLDPSRVQRRLDQCFGGRVNALLADWRAADPAVSLPAAEAFLAGIRQAFEAPPFDAATGGGVTEDQLLQVWASWNDWLSKKNASTPPSPTGSPPTAGPPG